MGLPIRTISKRITARPSSKVAGIRVNAVGKILSVTYPTKTIQGFAFALLLVFLFILFILVFVPINLLILDLLVCLDEVTDGIGRLHELSFVHALACIGCDVSPFLVQLIKLT